MLFGFLKFLLSCAHLMHVLGEVSQGSETVTGLFDLIAPTLFFTGLWAYCIPAIYGICIYMVALIITTLQKPLK